MITIPLRANLAYTIAASRSVNPSRGSTGHPDEPRANLAYTTTHGGTPC